MFRLFTLIVAHLFTLLFFSTRLITAYELSTSRNRQVKYTFQLLKIVFLRKLGEFFFSFIFFYFLFLSWRTVGEQYGERGGKNTKFRLFFVGTWNISFSRKKIYGVKFFFIEQQLLGYEIKNLKSSRSSRRHFTMRLSLNYRVPFAFNNTPF